MSDGLKFIKIPAFEGPFLVYIYILKLCFTIHSSVCTTLITVIHHIYY